MEHIKTIETRNLCDSAKNGGCGECQTSCQSACKTSCGIANQKCESTKESKQLHKDAENLSLRTSDRCHWCGNPYSHRMLR